MFNFKMKLFTFCTLTAFLFSMPDKILAQRAVVGVRLMPTFSKLDVNNSSGGVIKGEVTLGYGVGTFLGFSFSRFIGIQAEIIYSSLSQKYKEMDVERNIRLKYLNIPLMLSLNTGKNKFVNLNVVAGPQVGISVGNRLVIADGGTPGSTDGVLSVKRGDLGFAYGAGVDFALNPAKNIRLGLGYRGVVGLIDISDDSRTDANNSYYLLDKSHIKTNAVYAGVSFIF